MAESIRCSTMDRERRDHVQGIAMTDRESGFTVRNKFGWSVSIDGDYAIVSAYLDLAESRAERGIIMTMRDWIEFLHGFLELSNYPILTDKGRISALEAKLKAEQEYDEYRKVQDKNYLSDFDKEVKRLGVSKRKS